MSKLLDWVESSLMNWIEPVRRAVAYPLSCPEIDPGLRRCLLARFPYGLLYGLDGDTVVVVAIAHLHREPRY